MVRGLSPKFDLRFGEMREVELKGLAGLNRVYLVIWE